MKFIKLADPNIGAKEAKQVRPEMIIVPEDNLTVQELADKLSLESSEIIKSLLGL